MPDTLSHGVLWSLGLNVAVMVALSLRYRPAIGERLRVAGTRMLEDYSGRRGGQLLPGGATVGDLLLLAERLLARRRPAACSSGARASCAATSSPRSVRTWRCCSRWNATCQARSALRRRGWC